MEGRSEARYRRALDAGAYASPALRVVLGEEQETAQGRKLMGSGRVRCSGLCSSGHVLGVMLMLCPYCGAESPKQATTCPNCCGNLRPYEITSDPVARAAEVGRVLRRARADRSRPKIVQVGLVMFALTFVLPGLAGLLSAFTRQSRPDPGEFVWSLGGLLFGAALLWRLLR